MPVYNDIENAPVSGLQKLLLLAVPENKHGHKTLNHLAEMLHVTPWAVRKWIQKDQISPRRAQQVVDISEGRVSLADFSRFIFKL